MKSPKFKLRLPRLESMQVVSESELAQKFKRIPNISTSSPSSYIQKGSYLCVKFGSDWFKVVCLSQKTLRIAGKAVNIASDFLSTKMACQELLLGGICSTEYFTVGNSCHFTDCGKCMARVNRKAVLFPPGEYTVERFKNAKQGNRDGRPDRYHLKLHGNKNTTVKVPADSIHTLIEEGRVFALNS